MEQVTATAEYGAETGPHALSRLANCLLGLLGEALGREGRLAAHPHHVPRAADVASAALGTSLG